MNVRAHPSVLRGELVSDICMEGPVCLKYSEGLDLRSVGARPLVLKGELVRMSDWAHGVSSWARLCKL